MVQEGDGKPAGAPEHTGGTDLEQAEPKEREEADIEDAPWIEVLARHRSERAADEPTG